MNKTHSTPDPAGYLYRACIDTVLPFLKLKKLPTRRRNIPVTLPHRLECGSRRPRQRLASVSSSFSYNLTIDLFLLIFVLVTILYYRFLADGVSLSSIFRYAAPHVIRPRFTPIRAPMQS